MNPQPDKLFRDKLEHHQLSVSANAWNRVEARLDKKNNKMLWLQIAASLVFVLVSGYVVWQLNRNDNTEASPMAESVKSNTPVEIKEEKTNNNEIDQNKNSTTQPVAAVEKKQTPARKERGQIKKENSVQQVPVVVNEPEVSIAQVEELPEETITTQEVITEIQPEITVSAEPVKKNSRVVIVLSSEEVDSKYLDKKSLAEATSDEKKPSTLRKLLDKAGDLAENQEVFGDLRQKKNEILALNFKNEKRSQNK